MALTAENSFVSNDAKLYWLQDDAEFPATLEALIPAGSREVGYLQEDGETFSQSVTRESVRAHQGRTKIRTFTTDNEQTLQVTCLESNPIVHALYYGVEPDANGKIVTNGARVITGKFVYDSIDDDTPNYEKAVRYNIYADATANGDLVYLPGGVVVFPIMLTAIKPVEIIHSIPEVDATPSGA